MSRHAKRLADHLSIPASKAPRVLEAIQILSESLGGRRPSYKAITAAAAAAPTASSRSHLAAAVAEAVKSYGAAVADVPSEWPRASSVKDIAYVLRSSTEQAARIYAAVHALCGACGAPRADPGRVFAALSFALSDADLHRLTDSLRAARPKVITRKTYKKTGRPVREPGAPPPPRRDGPLWLESWSGTYVDDDACRCDMPGCTSKAKIRYAKSSWGRVHLCLRHRAEVREATFGRVDASKMLVDRHALEHDHRDGKREGIVVA